MLKLHLLLILVYVSAYEYGIPVEEGTLCKKRSAEPGVCTHFINCESAIHEVRRNGRPEICSFNGIYPIVCCSSNNHSQVYTITRTKQDNNWFHLPFNEKSISMKKCREYHSMHKDDTLKYRTYISETKGYAHIALLGVSVNNNVQWLCTGALINEEFVLTSANCLQSRIGPVAYVRLGELKIDPSKYNAQSQDFKVKARYAHPNFKRPLRYNDIGLVQLDKPANLTESVRPACLAVTENLNQTLPEISGWGLNYFEWSSKNLGTDYMQWISSEDCAKIYKPSPFLKNGIADTQICAINGGIQKTLCHADVGGPMQITNFFYEFNNFPEIVGVASLGNDCSISASVFTRVFNYVPWIEQIVWPNS